MVEPDACRRVSCVATGVTLFSQPPRRPDDQLVAVRHRSVALPHDQLPRVATNAAFTHLTADLTGISAARLRDRSLLSGLLIAAAGAGGLSTEGPPVLRRLAESGVGALLLVDGGHLTVHAFPDRELLLLDVLTLSTHDARKVLDVFVRRLTPGSVRSDNRARG